MKTIIFNKEQIQDLVWDNRYKLEKEQPETNLDELALIIATGETYGFEVDREKANKILKEVEGKAYKLPNQGKRFNGAVLQIKGDYSVVPNFYVGTDEGNFEGEMFVFHETFTNRQHRVIAKKLIEEKAVKLFPGCDEEYLYETLSEVTENHLFETLKRLVSGLPIYQVTFESDGSFNIKEMGKINNSE